MNALVNGWRSDDEYRLDGLCVGRIRRGVWEHGPLWSGSVGGLVDPWGIFDVGDGASEFGRVIFVGGCRFGVYGRWQAEWMGVVVGGRILWGFDDLFDVSDGVSRFDACQATLGDARPRSMQFDFRDRSLRSWPVASGQILGRVVDLP